MRRYILNYNELEVCNCFDPCLLLPHPGHKCNTITKIITVCNIQPIWNIHIYTKPQNCQIAKHCLNEQPGNTLKYIPWRHSSEDKTVLHCSALHYIKIPSLCSRFLQLQHVEVTGAVAYTSVSATTTTIVVHDVTHVCKSVLDSDF